MKQDDDTIEFNDDNLEKLQRILGNKLPTAQVGILGGSSRSDGLTNAEVGAAHEFGTSRLPQRSFLRMPLIDKLNNELDKSGAFTDDVLKEVLKSGSAIAWMTKIAAVGESVVLQAFSSGGFGKWVPHASGYENNTGQILVDTTQLRNSITSRVKA